MLEINPVLAGTFDNPAYAASYSAATDVDATTSTTSVDPRRYTQFDRTSLEVHTDNNMSFDDFLDVINPLQHIPVVSSVYRAATNTSINPVSRITGDMLYGGVFGVASALIGCIGAVGNSVMEAATGKDVGGTMVASIFGDDTPAAAPAGATTMLADAGASAPSVTASATTPASTIMAGQNQTQAAAPATQSQLFAAKTFPLNRNKLPFGGVMAPSSTTSPASSTPSLAPQSNPLPTTAPTLSNAAMAAAMPINPMTNGVRIGNTIYTNRFANARAMPSTGSTSSAAAPATAPILLPQASATMLPQAQSTMTGTQDAGTATLTGHNNPLPQALIDDMMMMKQLQNYQNTAGGKLGATVNVTN